MYCAIISNYFSEGKISVIPPAKKMPSVDQLDPSFRGINEDVPQALKDPVEVQKLLLTEQMKSAEARVNDKSGSLCKYFEFSRASTS